MTYQYRKLEPGQRYTPAVPPKRMLRYAVLGPVMASVLGMLFYVEPA